jgi:hypothetical protein
MAEERLVSQEELCSMEIINWLPPSLMSSIKYGAILEWLRNG